MKKLTVSMTRPEYLLGWIYLPVQLLVMPALLVLVNHLLGYPFSESQVNFIFFCVNFLCTTVIFHKYLWNSVKLTLRTPWRCIRSAVAGFVLYWVLNMAVGVLIQFAYPDFFNVNDDSIGQLVQENARLIGFGTVLLVPVAEELLYRGLLFRSLYNRNRLAAYVISAAVFSALHVVGYVGQYEPLHLALCFLQYLPASLCLGWAYAQADSIFAPMLIHVCVNLIGILSMQ